MTSPQTHHADHFHAVQFYRDAVSLADVACTFISEALTRGEPGLMIAMREHAEFFRNALPLKGVDVEVSLASGLLTLLDAEETLSKFTQGGVPMAEPFTATLTPVLSGIAAKFPGSTIRAYGEMVDVLWRRDQTSAIRLEVLWNNLAQSHDFALLCAYSVGNFYKASTTADICAQHSHVITETGSAVRLT